VAAVAVLVGHSALLDSSQALTIEAWVQPWTPPLENLGYVFDHAGAIHVGGGYALQMPNIHGDAAGAVHISHGPGTNWDALGSPAMPVNAWYHLVGAYDAAAMRYRFYVNGQDIYGTGRDLLTPDPINYYQQLDLAIGNRLTEQGGIDRGFYGLIDEVRVFNRALSEQEVLAIYQAGDSGVCKAIVVSIDIKPGNHPNSINLGSNGTVAVGILSSASFDATTVNPITVTLAGAAVGLKGKGTPMAAFADLNDDGRLDLVVHVSTEALQLSDGDTEAELTGQTFDGRAIAGVDTVRIVSSRP
jgi:hypothetical protein